MPEARGRRRRQSDPDDVLFFILIMIQGLVLLVAGQLVGEAVVTVTGLPVPSAVVGMVFVLAALLARKGQMPEVRRAGHTLLMLVPLFLVPVSVGIMEQFDALRADAWPLTAALCVSIVLGMAATGLAVRWFSRFDGPGAHTVTDRPGGGGARDE